ncbi:MAG: FHA domain-containing protein [Synergistaceae bacterium]|jgi:hypothetical protein|nr:FHA domain-containing protein [Synergistaceae bacterium]
MELVKLCPACGDENPISEIICRVCMTNLSLVSPTPMGSAAAVHNEPEAGEGEIREEEMTISSQPAELALSSMSDGRQVSVGSGCVLGRSGTAGAFFSDLKTVSRRHARVDFSGGSWQIEDLGSTNGTKLNGRFIEPGRPYTLKAGDIIGLSAGCELRVMR